MSDWTDRLSDYLDDEMSGDERARLEEALERDAELRAVQEAQGRSVFGVEMRIIDDAGKVLPWDGETFGALQVRGPWVCSDYFRQEGRSEAHGADGFNNFNVFKI